MRSLSNLGGMAVHKNRHFNEFVLREELKEELKRIEALRRETVISLRKRNWIVRGLLFVAALALFLVYGALSRPWELRWA